MNRFLFEEGKQTAFVRSLYVGAGTVPWHKHRRAQLEYVSNGAIKVQTEEGIWITPPQRAVWILPGVNHTIFSSHPFQLCTLLLEPTLIELPPKCGVVEIEPLMRELLIAAAQFGSEYEKGSPQDHLMRVILERLPKKLLTPLHLPEPKDCRLQRIAKELYENPFDKRSLSALADTVGISTRTIDRIFSKETGMPLGKWRQQLRLITALQKLADKEKVTNVALDAGYCNVSDFIKAFKNKFGVTPSHYFGQANK